MERLFETQLAQAASRIMGRMASTKIPQPLLRPLINAYVFGMGVRLEEALEPEGGYQTFSDFFGRKLRPGSRPISNEPSSFVAPCDGEIVATGEIDINQRARLTVKGSQYNLSSLLGCDVDREFGAGGYAIIYLHPRDYHRVHVPTESRLTRMRHIPGARYPVNHWLEDRVDQIYGKNERLVFHFELDSGLKYALVMIAAFGVGNMETKFPFGSDDRSDVPRERDIEPAIQMERGEELGAFLIGSTVALVWAENTFELDDTLGCGSVAMGNRLGKTVG